MRSIKVSYNQRIRRPSVKHINTNEDKLDNSSTISDLGTTDVFMMLGVLNAETDRQALITLFRSTGVFLSCILPNPFFSS